MNKLTMLAMFLSIAITATAHPGIGIVQDSKGNVFYTDLKHVWKIDPQDRRSIAVRDVHTHELYIDEEDNLFGEHLWYEGEATDRWGHYVWRLSAQGILEKAIPDSEGFLTGYSFVRDHDGNMFWAAGENGCEKLVRRNHDNTVAKLATDCFEDIRCMTVGKNGDVYLMDDLDLKKVTRQGHVHTIARQIQESSASIFNMIRPRDPHAVMGLTVDKHDNVYAAVPSGRKIKKFSKDGTVSVAAEIDSPWYPSGVLVTDNGDLYVLEYTVSGSFAARVERFSKGGKSMAVE